MLQFIRKNFWSILFILLLLLEFTRPDPFGGISNKNKLFERVIIW